MKKLRVGIIDLVTKSPNRGLWARTMNANFASIMPQVVATWCEQDGHDVHLVCYTGLEDVRRELPGNCDLVFISGFSQAAQLAYALSNRFRAEGCVTALGGPHARCYPLDARKYFDYVFGFTHREMVREVLRDCAPHRPMGLHMAADRQPESIPGVRERWKHIEQTLRKAPTIKIVPMIGSMGCPYTCSFCIDADVPYQPLAFDVMNEDLQFLLTKFKRPRVGWHDPNFGIRFNDYMEAIESTIPPDSIDFIAESSLAILSESHLKRLKRAGFKGMLPGIESWFDLGDKSKTGSKQGEQKVRAVSDHVNMVLSYIPYVQTNFVLGLDSEDGPEPYRLTRQFIDLTPGTFPGYSLLSSFGRAAPLNLQYQRDDRVLPVPFHFLNNNHAMNVKPLNYTWPEFYDRVIEVTEHSFSWPAISRRFNAGKAGIPAWLNTMRAISSEGFGRLKYYRRVRSLLDEDRHFRDYFERETDVLPEFFVHMMKRDLGELWEWLPEGAIYHDPLAYLKSMREAPAPRTSETKLPSSEIRAA